MKKQFSKTYWSLLLVAFFALFISSCATEDSAVEKGSGVLSITLGGVNDQESIVRSEKTESQSQMIASQTVTLDNGLIASCEMKEDISSQKKSTTPMTTGYTYRIVVLDGSNNVVVTKDYTAGSISPFSLPVGTYTVVAYSFNNTVPLPAATSPLTIPSGVDLLYFSQASVTVTSGATTPVNIVFDHKFSEVELVVDSHALIVNKTKADLGETITAGAATLDNNYGVKMSVADGSLTADAATTPVNFSWSGSSKRLTSPIHYGYCNGGVPTIKISSLTFVGGTTLGGLSFTFNTAMTAGKKYTFVLNCTLKGDNNTWLTFMCHNLGADYTLDPDNMTQANAWKLNGAYIQWGKHGPSGNSRDTWQTAPSDGPNGFAAAPQSGAIFAEDNGGITGWSTTVAPDYSWLDSNGAKTTNDPCPDGWRIPTELEWTAVANNNSYTMEDNHIDDGLQNHFSSAVHLGNVSTAQTLTLPAASYREAPFDDTVRPGGISPTRGWKGFYWASTSTNDGIGSYAFGYWTDNSIPGVDLYSGASRLYGGSVRCIAEY